MTRAGLNLEPLFDATLSARGFVPVWLAAGLAVVAVATTLLIYRREAGRISLPRRGGLAAVRAVALVSILALLLKPTLIREVRGEKARPVVLLVDDTQSMTTQDARPVTLDKWRAALAFDKAAPDALPPTGSSDIPAGTPETPTRIEVVQAALTNPRLRLLAALRDIAPVQPSRFGGGRMAVDPRDDAWVNALAGKEARTAVADSIADLLKRDPADLPVAVVAVTDGRDNASRASVTEVAAECARLGVPLLVYAVGGSAAGQIVLRDAAVPETLFVDDTVVVPVRFRGRGFKDAQVELVAKLNGHEVARKVVTLADGEDQRDTLSFVPLKHDVMPGKQDFTVTVRVVTDAAQPADEVTKAVRVVDRKLKVLVAESSPRWDFKFLQRALLRDRRVEATFWLTQADREALAAPPFVPTFPSTREELAAYDLLILGDLPAAAFTPAQLEAIRDYVAEGGGVVHIAGRSGGPATWLNTPLADILPVELSADTTVEAAARSEPFKPVPTPAAARGGVLRLDDDPAESARLWAELPGVHWFYPAARLKPAAETLLAHPTARMLDGKPAPLLAAHYYGKGYVLFAAFDETWRWRYNAADKYFGRYWSQLVYVAGVPRTTGTRLTQLALDSADPLVGGAGQVYARLLKKDLTPQAAESVEAVVEQLDAPAGTARTRRVTLRRVPGQPGEYTAAVPFAQTGRFALTVDNGGSPGAVEYRVSLPPDHELSPGGPAEDELKRLAELSGGKFYREEDLHTLPAAVVPKSTPTLTREETVLWNRWAFVWVAGLFALEWVLRKFSGLS